MKGKKGEKKEAKKVGKKEFSNPRPLNLQHVRMYYISQISILMT